MIHWFLTAWHWLVGPYLTRKKFEQEMQKVTLQANFETARSMKEQEDLGLELSGRTSSLTNDVFGDQEPPPPDWRG